MVREGELRKSDFVGDPSLYSFARTDVRLHG
jgi:hypothetical protein